MPNYEPIDYRLRCHTKRTDLPADVLRDIGEAYAEIEQLRQERDEARVSVCLTALPPEYKTWRPEQVDHAVKLIAKDMGWDCFKDNP